jgi:hypothetical protein
MSPSNEYSGGGSVPRGRQPERTARAAFACMRAANISRMLRPSGSTLTS